MKSTVPNTNKFQTDLFDLTMAPNMYHNFEWI